MVTHLEDDDNLLQLVVLTVKNSGSALNGIEDAVLF